MNNFFSNRNVTIINFSIIAFFTGVYLLDKYEVDAVLIGVFRELLTIPFLGALLFFSILGLRYFIVSKTKTVLRSISNIALIALLTFFITGFITFWKF